MTSWLLTWANRAPFEALPQKPHPLERRVKNTEVEIISLRATCPEEGGWAVTPQPDHRCRKEGHRAHWVGLAGLGGKTPMSSSQLGRHCCSTPKKAPSPELYCPQIRPVYILSSREKVYAQPTLCWTGCERGICLCTRLRLVPHRIPSTRSPVRSHFHSRRKLKRPEITLVDICLSGSKEVTEPET